MKIRLFIVASFLGQTAFADYPCLPAAKQVRLSQMVFDSLVWVPDSSKVSRACNNDMACVRSYQDQYNSATVALDRAQQAFDIAKIGPLRELDAAQRNYSQLYWVTDPRRLGDQCRGNVTCVTNYQAEFNRALARLVDAEDRATGCL